MQEHIRKQLPDPPLPNESGDQSDDVEPIDLQDFLDQEETDVKDYQVLDNRSYTFSKTEANISIAGVHGMAIVDK